MYAYYKISIIIEKIIIIIENDMLLKLLGMLRIYTIKNMLN